MFSVIWGHVMASDLLSKKKTAEILRALSGKSLGVREIQRVTGGSFSTILKRVEELENAGLVKKVQVSGRKSSLQVTYRGSSLIRLLQYTRPEPPSDFIKGTISAGPRLVRKRDGRLEPFDRNMIFTSIWKAVRAVGGKDRPVCERLTDQVVTILKGRFAEIPTVNEIQDVVEEVHNLQKAAPRSKGIGCTSERC